MTPGAHGQAASIQDLTQALLRGLLKILEGKLYGVYLYGAVAFPDTDVVHDIDFHVILTETLSEKEKQDIHDLHATLGKEFPRYGRELDGYYILLEEALNTTPAEHQLLPGVVDGSWALHREHIRVGRCIVLHGPDPNQIFPPCSWQDLEASLLGELRYIEDHLHEFTDYCILNLCRLMYSIHTRDVVVSKLMSAVWAQEIFPDWASLIQAARNSYNKKATPDEEEMLDSKIDEFLEFSRIRILNIITTKKLEDE
jgi:predicted nucleotidyltransferase